MIGGAESAAARGGGKAEAVGLSADGPGAGDEGGTWRAGLARRWRATTGKQRLLILAGLLAAVALIAGWRHLDLEGFHAWAKSLPALAVATLVGVLPLAGFPVSALHLAAGVRFEFWPALLVVGLTTLFQHVAAWALTRALPARLFARLQPWREKMAGAGHGEAAVLCCLLPGMPYTAQLYLLPVMGVSLRIICLVGASLHTARATATILLGNISDELTPPRVAALAAYYLVIFTICGFAVRRMRSRLGRASARSS
jgi:uncharacterized membrane protein YdjX (TVP38/TMEM64 family)